MTRYFKLKFGVEKLLLIGAVIALVFSNAEGVSLLPFPGGSNDATENFGGGQSRSTYSQSVKPGRSIQAKHAKGKQFAPLGGTAGFSDAVTPRPRFVAAGSLPASEAAHFTSPHPSSRTTRGPPSA